MNVYIPMEIKAREFEGRGLLALVAAERGHVVIFGGKEDTFSLAEKGYLQPGIIHEMSLNPSLSKIKLLNNLCQKGFILTSQDEEHGLLYKSYLNFAKQRFSEETIEMASSIFCWGNHDKQSLCMEYKNYHKRFLPTGSPRTDFWRKEFTPYYVGQKNDLQNNLKPYILIAANFKELLDVNRFWNIITMTRKGGYYDRDLEEEYRTYEFAAFQTKLAGEFIRMIRKLATSFEDINIIIRPHPIESVDGWNKLIGDYPNVYVLRDGTISGWIRNALVLIHNGSSSALEAAVCDIPRISYMPIPWPISSEYAKEVPASISYTAYSIEDLLEIVNLIFCGKEIPGSVSLNNDIKEILNKRFANLNGELAADRIVNQWERLMGSTNVKQYSINELILKSLKYRTRGPVASTAKSLLNLTVSSLKKKDDFITAHKFPGLNESEMRSLLLNLQKTIGRFHNVRFKRFGRRSFIIYSK